MNRIEIKSLTQAKVFIECSVKGNTILIRKGVQIPDHHYFFKGAQVNWALPDNISLHYAS